jgi:histidyl-tRNA synthetase
MFGGERFDKLINIFGNYDLPATGFALGDWTLKEFLLNWNLLPKNVPPAEYFVTIWPSQDKKCLKASLAVTEELRKKGKNVFMWLDQSSKLDKQLKAADKKQITFALIIGENELRDGTITVKDLGKMTQKTEPLDKFIGEIK